MFNNFVGKFHTMGDAWNFKKIYNLKWLTLQRLECAIRFDM